MIINLEFFFTSPQALELFTIFKVRMSFISHKVIKSYSISYKNMEESMIKIVKFDYAIIIFISLLVVAMDVDAGPIRICSSDDDCIGYWCPLSIQPRSTKPICRLVESISKRSRTPVGLCTCI
ncbi:putative Late nodulin [Medicago truncatula]|nr:putative Late nodulin [Medicago truncatula]